MRDYAERARIERFLGVLGRRLRLPIRLYLVGGSVIVDMGLREATLDVDYVAQSDDPLALEEFERLLPQLKNELGINVEPASPADFIPVPRDVLDRSTYVRSYGNVHVYYYDLPSTIISKAARGAERDFNDIEAVIRAGALSWDDVENRWEEIRVSPRGWLRYSPDRIDQRLRVLRDRLFPPASESESSEPPSTPTDTVSASSDQPTVHIPEYRRRDGRVVREHWRRRRRGE